jgi:hypothetical protein
MIGLIHTKTSISHQRIAKTLNTVGLSGSVLAQFMRLGRFAGSAGKDNGMFLGDSAGKLVAQIGRSLLIGRQRPLNCYCL